jgi:hypothetical protein
MSYVKRTFAWGVMIAALTVLIPRNSWSRAAEPGAQDAIREVSIMAKVLETRLREELHGDLVSGTIFQPGGVRGFRVPGIGAIFEINVNFPVAEIKASDKPGEPAKSGDLWDRVERGGGTSGFGGAGGGYGAVYSVAPADPSVVPAPPAQPVPSTPVSRSTRRISGTTPVPQSQAGDGREKTATMERVILETLARYGERLKSVAPDESIIVLVSGTGGPKSYSYSVRTSATPARQPGERYDELLKTFPAMRKEMDGAKEAGEQMAKAVAEMEAAKKALEQVKETMDAEAKKATEEKMKAVETKMQQMQEKVSAAQERIEKAMAQMTVEEKARFDERQQAAADKMKFDELKKANEALSIAHEQYERLPDKGTRGTTVRQPVYTYSVARPSGAVGASSWVLKVKKSDLVNDPDKLRKRAEIQSYVGSYAGIVGERIVEVLSSSDDPYTEPEPVEF